MWDSLYLGIFILLAAILAYDSFNKWRSSKKILYLIAISVFILAVITLFSSRTDTIFLIIGGMILRMIAQYSGNKKSEDGESSKGDDGNLE